MIQSQRITLPSFTLLCKLRRVYSRGSQNTDATYLLCSKIDSALFKYVRPFSFAHPLSPPALLRCSLANYGVLPQGYLQFPDYYTYAFSAEGGPRAYKHLSPRALTRHLNEALVCLGFFICEVAPMSSCCGRAQWYAESIHKACQLKRTDAVSDQLHSFTMSSRAVLCELRSDVGGISMMC